MKAETYIRIIELVLAFASTYMVAITLIKTSFYINVIRNRIGFLISIFMGPGANESYVDYLIIGMVLAISSHSFCKASGEVAPA